MTIAKPMVARADGTEPQPPHSPAGPWRPARRAAAQQERAAEAALSFIHRYDDAGYMPSFILVASSAMPVTFRPLAFW